MRQPTDIIEVSPPHPTDLILDLRLNGEDLVSSTNVPEVVGFAVDHIRARLAGGVRIAPDVRHPVRNVAGDVIGSWAWGWKRRQ